MIYEILFTDSKRRFLLNLIDTPGHTDFAFEVSRSVHASSGALLLVDATQGIQSQTMANFYTAFAAGLHIVPVLNKIDVADADDVARVAADMCARFEVRDSDIIRVCRCAIVFVVRFHSFDRVCARVQSGLGKNWRGRR